MAAAINRRCGHFFFALLLVGCNAVLGLDSARVQDLDGDEVFDEVDNCLTVPNPDQADSDHDGIGDACDRCPGVRDSGLDADHDGVDDACDPCPRGPQHDEDGDGAFDACDLCPTVAGDQADANGDGVGDACADAAVGAQRIELFDAFAPPDPRWREPSGAWTIEPDSVFGASAIRASAFHSPRIRLDGPAWSIETQLRVDEPPDPTSFPKVGIQLDLPVSGAAATCELVCMASRCTVALSVPGTVIDNVAPIGGSFDLAGSFRLRMTVRGHHVTCGVDLPDVNDDTFESAVDLRELGFSLISNSGAIHFDHVLALD